MTDHKQRMARLRRQNACSEKAEMAKIMEDLGEYYAKNGLAREFPFKFAPDSFFYSHVATTEQRAAIDDCFVVDERIPGTGMTVGGWIALRSFVENPDRYLGEMYSPGD